MTNAYGKGWLCSGVFVVRGDCPVHGASEKETSLAQLKTTASSKTN